MAKILKLQPKIPKETIKLKVLADTVDGLIESNVVDNVDLREILYILSQRLGTFAAVTDDPIKMVDLMSDLMYETVNNELDLRV